MGGFVFSPGHSSSQAVITQTLRNAVPERALQIAGEVGRWGSGWASGVLGAVDRWLSDSASHSSAELLKRSFTLAFGGSPPTRGRWREPLDE